MYRAAVEAAIGTTVRAEARDGSIRLHVPGAEIVLTVAQAHALAVVLRDLSESAATPPEPQVRDWRAGPARRGTLSDRERIEAWLNEHAEQDATVRELLMADMLRIALDEHRPCGCTLARMAKVIEEGR